MMMYWNKIKEMVLHNWSFMRWLRLGMAVFFGVEAIRMHNAFMGFFVVFFLVQAVFNVGICGMGGCSVPVKKKSTDDLKDVEFVEIK